MEKLIEKILIREMDEEDPSFDWDNGQYPLYEVLVGGKRVACNLDDTRDLCILVDVLNALDENAVVESDDEDDYDETADCNVMAEAEWEEYCRLEQYAIPEEEEVTED